MSPLRQLLLLALISYFLGSIPFGLLVGLWPYSPLPALVAFTVFLITFFTWRYVSLASIAAALSFPIAYAIAAIIFRWPLTNQQLPLLLFAIIVAALIVYKHRTNIA